MILLNLAIAAGTVLAQTRTATVVSVGDGDTLRVRSGGRLQTVRLACIDAPETSQAPHGTSARQQLQALAPVGTPVELRIKATDRYGRSVAELSRNGRNLNQALVASGVAFVYWQYIAGCDRQIYGRLENEARLKGLGVWGVSGGVTRPWDYRSAQRHSGATPSGRRYTCKQIGSYAQAQVLLRQGHSYLDGDGDGEACEGLRGQALPEAHPQSELTSSVSVATSAAGVSSRSSWATIRPRLRKPSCSLSPSIQSTMSLGSSSVTGTSSC